MFTGKSAACPAFLPVGRGEEGGNGLSKWSQSRPYNHIYITRKLAALSADRQAQVGQLHSKNSKRFKESYPE